MSRPTPLDPNAFFVGEWHGEGTFRPPIPLRWLVPAETVRLVSRPIWLSDTRWRVEERFEFSRSPAIDRVMLVEIAGPGRLTVTATDFPDGAEILLDEGGFRFAPYRVRVRRFGLEWTLRCRDHSRIGGNGVIENVIRMSLLGLPVAVMSLWVRRLEGTGG